MHIRRTEHPNFTLEQVTEHVRDSLKIADDLELSDADRRTLLPTIMEKVSSKQVTLEAIEGLANMAMPRGLG